MSSVAVAFTVLLLVSNVPSLTHSRALLNIFQNDECETQFERDITNTVFAGNGTFHCFRNHVSCIDYELTVLGGQGDDRPQLLVVIAETGSVDDVGQNRLSSYLDHTVCIGSDCEQELDVNENRHYSVIVINSDFEDPEFNGASGEDVTYRLELRGCLTTTQRLVIALTVIIVLLAVVGCFSCCYVHYRRTRHLEATKQEPPTLYDGQEQNATELTDQGSSVQGSTVPLQPFHQPSSMDGSIQSATPWAAPVTSPTHTANSSSIPPRF